MAETSIEWTGTELLDGSILPGYTFNPWIGCTKVSLGCKNCYAEADMAHRRKRVTWGPLPKGTRVVTGANYWQQPLKWEKEAAKSGIRRKVFCASLADVFEDWQGEMLLNTTGEFQGSPLMRWPDGSWHIPGLKTEIPGGARYLTMQHVRERLFRLIEETPHLDWLLLTKRPENVMRMVPEGWRKEFPQNVWMGTSVEDQETADARLHYLVEIPAVVRFVSGEPLISLFTLAPWLDPDRHNPCQCGDGECHECWRSPAAPTVSWVIVGGESGRNARPFDPQDAHWLMRECKEAGVPFFFKQMGSAPYDKFNDCAVKIRDPKGSDWEGYDDLRVRQWPEVVR